MKTKTLVRALSLVLLGASLGSASALDLRPDGVAVQGSVGTHDTWMAGGAVVWDWRWERLRRKAEITGHTELFVNHWRADALAGGRNSYTQFGVMPVLRFNLSQGRSPWYLELGVGVSWMDRRFQTAERSFSTRFNFYDVLGAGYVFGERRQHELGLRVIHISNGGIKEPNPGQEFLQLRYLSRF
jgi:lipid A 3-O-deacylase